MTPDPIETSQQKPPAFVAQRLVPSLIFFAVAIFCLAYVWYPRVTYDTDVSHWYTTDVVIDHTRITLPDMRGERQLAVDFSAEYQGVTRDYRLLAQGTKPYLENLAEDLYPVGGTMTVYINPNDPTDFTVKEPIGYGPWIAGFVPGVICLLIANLILFGVGHRFKNTKPGQDEQPESSS